jgi:hypothetical protein
MSIELITALGEVIKIGKGLVGWLICLHNLCLGDPKGSPFLLPINSLPQALEDLFSSLLNELSSND